MEADKEQYPNPNDTAANFDRFIYGIISRLDDEHEIFRLNDLSDFFVSALELVNKNDECNAALAAAGRADLGITHRAAIAPVDEPVEMADARFKKFAEGFRLYTDMDMADKFTETRVLTPVTREEVNGLKRLPKINSRAEYEALFYAQSYRAISDINTHATKPAFLRMLVLFPGISKDLVLKMSDPSSKSFERELIPELFVAYQLMSRLVDETDVDIAAEGEPSPDAGYLLG